MVGLELVDIFPELNGTLPHRDGGRWWIERDGKLVEVDVRLRVFEPANERPLVDPSALAVSLHDGGALTVEETETGFAIVRSTGERKAGDWKRW